MNAHAANAYRRVHLESASPARLLDELYVRLLADMEDAGRHLAAGDLAGKGLAISHALAIVGELQAALDPRGSPVLCANLARLYDFTVDRLTNANVKADAAPLLEARRVIATLQDAFGQVAGTVR